jgi:hypothetical protein
MRAYMWDRMKDWLLKGAIETDEKMAMDLAGPGYHINREYREGSFIRVSFRTRAIPRLFT